MVMSATERRWTYLMSYTLLLYVFCTWTSILFFSPFLLSPSDERVEEARSSRSDAFVDVFAHAPAILAYGITLTLPVTLFVVRFVLTPLFARLAFFVGIYARGPPVAAL